MTIYIEDEKTGELMQTLKSFTFDNILEDIRVARFKWDPKGLPKNRFYVVKANLINTLFDNKEENVTTTVKKLQNKINYSFYIDKYLIAWENGEKFFPFGLYFPSIIDEDLERLKNSPFNLIVAPGISSDSIKHVYDKTNKQVRVINSLGIKMPYSVTPQNLEMVRNKTLEKINKCY